jgi:hypothetical protein
MKFRAAWVVQAPLGVGSDAGEVHAAAVEFDEEQHVVAA